MPILLERYRALAAAGKIKADPLQEAVLVEMQDAYDDLAGEARQGRGPARSLLNRFLRPAQAGSDRQAGLYLYGSVGRGKTMMMDLFYDTLPPSVSKKRTHFHKFMIGVHAWLHELRQDKSSKGGVEQALPRYAESVARECRVLCFDEFHVTDIADAMILGRLFQALFDRGVFIVATTNWAPDRLYEGGLQRDRFLPFIDLIRTRMTIIHLDSPTDYRLRDLREAGVYFHPLNAASQGRADELFSRLTDAAEPADETLTVRGRDIHVPAAAKGVARFSFALLCEKPVGAEDYLVLCGAYHTLFIEGVPRLGYDRRNETKRFMTLIDVLYENRRRVVMTADAAPDRLYHGHDYEFEFQRTVSRLIEMQSATYLEATASAV